MKFNLETTKAPTSESSFKKEIGTGIIFLKHYLPDMLKWGIYHKFLLVMSVCLTFKHLKAIYQDLLFRILIQHVYFDKKKCFQMLQKEKKKLPKYVMLSCIKCREDCAAIWMVLLEEWKAFRLLL